MAIVIIVNTCIFVLVLIKLSIQNTPGKRKNDSKSKKVKDRLKKAVLFFILLGLTWSIGYLTLVRAASFLAQLFFCLLNSMLGYFLFMIYVVRRKEIRKQWSAWCQCNAYSKFTTSSLSNQRATGWFPASQRNTSSGQSTVNGVPAPIVDNQGLVRVNPILPPIEGTARRWIHNNVSIPLTAVERNRMDTVGSRQWTPWIR